MTAGGGTPHGVAKLWEGRIQATRTDNMIVGYEPIMKYLKLTNYTTFRRWVEEHALPVVKRPDGIWVTTMTAIDEWIFLAAAVNGDRNLYNAAHKAAMATKLVERKRAADEWFEGANSETRHTKRERA